MLTREDYKNYLSQMDLIEARMRVVYFKCLQFADTAELKQTFTDLIVAEKKHYDILKSLELFFE